MELTGWIFGDYVLSTLQFTHMYTLLSTTTAKQYCEFHTNREINCHHVLSHRTTDSRSFDVDTNQCSGVFRKIMS